MHLIQVEMENGAVMESAPRVGNASDRLAFVLVSNQLTLYGTPQRSFLFR